MKREIGVVGLSVILATVIAGVGGCGGSPTTNSSVGTPPPPAAVLMSMNLTGNASLTAAGQTSKLMATGTFSDGTTADISAKVQWTSPLTSVATVSASGLLTATGLGATDIFVQSTSNRTLYKSLHATVTPPGTFVVVGWTRDPGNGPLGGVRVLNPASGQSTLSVSGGDSQGLFSLGGLTTGHFVFTKADYEDAAVDLAPDFDGDVPLQRVVRVTPGSVVSLELAPHDLDYLVAPNTHCSPCKMIRLTSPEPTTLRVKLTWTDKATHLALWANGQEFAPADSALEAVADLPVGAGETMVYVASLATLPMSVHVPFTLSSTVVTVAPRSH
jgi:Big-like domain-containing protein